MCADRLQLLPDCTEGCLQFAGLGGRGRHCRGMALLLFGCACLARLERCFSVREPVLEDDPRCGRQIKLRRQLAFAPRKPFGVRDCRGMAQTDPFDLDCGFAELFVNHVPHRTLELALPCPIDRTDDGGRQVSEE